jgi:hypothetical protein
MCFARRRILNNPRLVIILSCGVSKKCSAVKNAALGMATRFWAAADFHAFT